MDRLENIDRLKQLVLQFRNELSFLQSSNLPSDADMRAWLQEQLKAVQLELDDLRFNL